MLRQGWRKASVGLVRPTAYHDGTALTEGAARLELAIPIARAEDIHRARYACRLVCQRIGLSHVTAIKVMTAASEIVRSTLLYAGEGCAVIREVDGVNPGVEILVRAGGAGGERLAAVLNQQVPSMDGRGIGLNSIRRLVDRLDARSDLEAGTTVFLRKMKA